MKKFLTSWKFIFISTIIILISVLFYSMYKDELKPPAPGWSRGVFLFKTSGQDVIELKTQSFSSVPLDNNFITVWNEKNSLNYAVIDKLGNVLTRKKLDINNASSKKIKTRVIDGLIKAYSLDYSNLNEYDFQYKDGKVITNKTIQKDVTDFYLSDNLLVYSTNKGIKIIDNDKTVDINIQKVSLVDAIKKINGNYYIAAGIENKAVQRAEIDYIEYNPQTARYDIKKISNFKLGEHDSLENVAIGIDKDKAAIISVTRDNKEGDSTVTSFWFPCDNTTDVTEKILDIEGYDPAPLMFKDIQDKISFIISTEMQRGRKNTTINLAMYTYDNGNLTDKKYLTKTSDISMNPNILKIGNVNYIEWEDLTVTGKKIMLAGCDKAIIAKAGKLSGDEVKDLALSTLIDIATGLSFLLLIFMSIILPALAVIFIISLFSLRFVENEPGKVINIAIVIQLISKLYLAYRSVLNNQSIRAVVPAFMNNAAGLYLIILLTALVPVYCVKKKYHKKDNDKSFMEQYMFFAVLDMILYSLIFFPYYAL